MKKQQSGFTLVELIMVIVVLGILAAFALPRFANFGEDARRASMEAVAGAMRSASAIAHSAWLAGGGTAASVTLEGEAIALTNGYPTQASILLAAQIDGDQFDTTTAGVVSANGAPGTCQVTYTAATASAATPPVITAPLIALNTSGC